MTEFQAGPFTFEAVGRPLTINGQISHRWAMLYGSEVLAEKSLDLPSGNGQVAEQFGDVRAAFIRGHQPKATKRKNPLADGYRVRLVHSTEVTGSMGAQAGEFLALAPIQGVSKGMIDDRFPMWLVCDLGSVPMGADEFERLQAAHEAIADALQHRAVTAESPMSFAWLTDLLPAELLSDDPDVWRAPSSWELRHVVGEGSFTGVTGAKAAELVGVLPQNFRKYTAKDGASSRQAMSFAMWHLLIHKLGVKRA